MKRWDDFFIVTLKDISILVTVSVLGITSVLRFLSSMQYRQIKIKKWRSTKLRSKLGDEVVLKEFKPEQIFKQYIAREGIKVEFVVWELQVILLLQTRLSIGLLFFTS